MTGLACLASLSAVVTSLSLFCNILLRNTADALIVNAHRCPALQVSTGLQGKPKYVSLLSSGSGIGAWQGDHLEQLPLKLASCGRADSPRMSFYCQDLQVTVSPVDSTIQSIPVSVTISLSSFDHDTGILRTWTTTRAEPEFAALGVRLKKVLGADCVPTPPLPYSSPAVLEGYLQQVLELPDALRLPLVNDFLELPAHMAPEPVLSGEVVPRNLDCDLRSRFRSADPLEARSPPQWVSGSEHAKHETGATVAGAVVGGVVGGPMGAAVGAVAGRVAVGRDDAVGDLAKGAAAVADAAMRKAQDVNEQYDITRKARRAVATGAKAVMKVESDLRVRERASSAARKAVKAAKHVDEEHRVRERAAGAMKAAEVKARMAASAARKAERELRLRERVGKALRRVRTSVKSSVDRGRRELQPEDQ